MGAPGSTHDSRLLKQPSIYFDIINGNVIPNRVVQLGDFGEIPLVTIGDSVFPQFAWLIKAYNENTRDNQKKYFNKRVVAGNAYGMFKGRWRILFKKNRMPAFQPSLYCIEISDPCQPRWILEVDDLDLIRKRLRRADGKRV